MSRYYTPAEFAELKRIGLELGIGHIESGPLVRAPTTRTSRPPLTKRRLNSAASHRLTCFGNRDLQLTP